MATATTPTPATSSPTNGFRPFRITTEMYQRIAESGALAKAPRVILWDGQIVQKVADVTKNRPHITALTLLDTLLGRLLGEGFFLEQEQPIDLGRDRLPEPDLKCVRGLPADYLKRDPTPSDVPLIVEVADTSLADDQGVMLRAYAEAGIPVYWVVNVPKGRIEVYGGPTGPSPSPSYQEHRMFSRGEQAPVVLDGREVGRIAVSDVLY
ncbi:MAG: Uma2 family endonuclease [Isosphaeraceae bacterium]